MLIFKETKFIKSPFDSEAELEQVIVENYEYLFGPTSFYLPKAKITRSAVQQFWLCSTGWYSRRRK
jgi:hypothetical protein